MAISNISSIYFIFKNFCYAVNNFFIAYNPNRMLDVIISSEIVNRIFSNTFFQDIIDFVDVSESKKNIAGLCAGCFNMINSVLLLFRPGKFMFFDQSFFIIGYRTATNQTCLG